MKNTRMMLTCFASQDPLTVSEIMTVRLMLARANVGASTDIIRAPDRVWEQQSPDRSAEAKKSMFSLAVNLSHRHGFSVSITIICLTLIGSSVVSFPQRLGDPTEVLIA